MLITGTNAILNTDVGPKVNVVNKKKKLQVVADPALLLPQPGQVN